MAICTHKVKGITRNHRQPCKVQLNITQSVNYHQHGATGKCYQITKSLEVLYL